MITASNWSPGAGPTLGPVVDNAATNEACGKDLFWRSVDSYRNLRLTPEGEKYFAKAARLSSLHTSYTLKATRRIVEVTGITGDDHSKAATFTWTWHGSAPVMGQDVNRCISALMENVANNGGNPEFGGEHTEKAHFTLYDDGWRLERVGRY